MMERLKGLVLTKKRLKLVNNDLKYICFPLKRYHPTSQDLEYTLGHIHVDYIYGLPFILVC